MSGFTSVKIVGLIKKPFFNSGSCGLSPPRTNFAPSFLPVSIYSITLSNCLLETIGPISFVSIQGKPTGIFFAFSTKCFTKSSFKLLCTKTLEVELQDCPCLLKFIPLIAKSAANSGSASSNTISGFFPPSSRETFFR